MTRFICVFGLALLTVAAVNAQPPGRGGGDDGGRGGRGGPGFGGRGGGGPSGGFGGGRGSGGPGGGFSGRSGSGFSGRGGGSFDPSSFISRLDRNGNGVLDPDEQQGPAQFMISRMAQADSSIKVGQPIPMSKITDAVNKYREQRGDTGGRSSRGSNDSRAAEDEALIAELLVPGFGVEAEPEPLLGFGASAEMLSVTVTEADVREAASRIRQFDRNRDGFLSAQEMERFSGNPMDFDRNRDGKLSETELAVRYARRREGREEAENQSRGDRERTREREDSREMPDVYNGRRSYRVTSSRRLPEGVPGFFTDKDGDGDGQVTMAEYASEWSDDLIKEFFNYDFNRDGVITAEEAIRSVEEGGANQAMTASTASSSSPSSSGSSSTASSTPASLPPGTKADEKYVKVVTRIVDRYDKNKDGVLTPSEWGKMLMSPAAADADRDGKITVNEYALWMQARQKK